MLPAVVLSAQITIKGIADANAKLGVLNRNFQKVTASAEAAGVAVDKTGRKLDRLRAQAAIPIVQEIRVEVDDSGFEDHGIKKRIAEDSIITQLQAAVADKGFEDFGIKKHIAREGVTTVLSAVVDPAGFLEFEALKRRAAEDVHTTIHMDYDTGVGGKADPGFTAAKLTRDMTIIRQWDRGHPNFFGGSSGAGSNDIQKLIQMLQVMNSGRRSGSSGSSRDSNFAFDLGQLLTGHPGGRGRSSGFAPWWLRLGMGGGRLPGVGSLGSFAGFGAEHFLLSAGGVLGSAAAGAAGGALLGAGALGQLAVGAGSDTLVSAATIAATKEITEAQTKWNEAIKQYGYYSTQARTAQKAFNEAMREAGPAGQAELALGKHAKHLESFFKEQTGPARIQSTHVLNQVLGVGEAFVPQVASAADQNLQIINKDIKPLFAWLKGPEGMGIFDQLENKFKSELPTSIHAFTQAIEFVLKTVAVASKYTGGFIESVDKFFTKWNEPKNFSTWEGHIENLIEDFHMWMTFLKSVGKLLYDIFTNDAHTGSGIVLALTEMIDKADKWVTSTEGKSQLHNIFTIHKEEILALLSIIPPLVTIFRQVYMEVAPPLVHAATAVMIVIAKLLQKFEETGPIAKWALGIAVIAAKMGLLKPVMGWLWKQLDLLPTKLTAQEISNDKLVASNEALTASNQSLAESFAAVQAAASESSGAMGVNAATGEILTTHPGQLAMDIPDREAAAAGSQLSLFGQVPANATKSAAPAMEAEGKGLAGSLMGGIARFIPQAAAAYGVMNILTSVFDKGKNHLKEAGFEAGGALVGGVAGFLLGGPAGAMIGVGLGSLGGELLSKLFKSSSPKHPFAEQLQEEVRHSKAVSRGFEGALSGLRTAESRLSRDRVGNRRTTDALHDSEKHLNEVVKKYGPISNQAHRAERELADIRKKNKEATHAWASAQSLASTQQELAIEKAKEVINTDKPLLENLRTKVERAKEYERENGKTTETIEKVKNAEEQLVETQEKLHSSFRVLKTLAPAISEKYHEMTIAQHKWGTNYLALVPQMSTVTQELATRMEVDLLRAGKPMTTFQRETKENMAQAAEHIEDFGANGSAGIEQLMSTLNKSLSAMGVAKVSFHVKGEHGTPKHAPKAHHQSGGMIVPGGGSGDTVPLTAMVEPGEMVHVLNRNAVSDMKKLGQLERINRESPRFQSGGSMGGYTYPFSHANVSWGRVDEGVDFTGTGPIQAIGSGQVTSIMPNWYLNQSLYNYRLSDGPEAGKYIYIAEGINSNLGVGQKVKSGEVIASFAHGTANDSIETGWGAAGGNGTLAGGGEGATSAGQSFYNFLKALESGGGSAIFGSLGGLGVGSAAAIVPELEKLAMHGPKGSLTELGNEALSSVWKAATEYIHKHAPTTSIGGKFAEVQGNNAVEAAGKTLLAGGFNKIGTAGVLGNAWQESRWNPSSVGSGGGGMLGFTAGEISLAALQHKAELVHKPWNDPSFQMAFALEHISSGIKSATNAQKTPEAAARYFMENWERPAVETENLANREAGARKAFSMGLQKGGAHTKKGEVAHPIKTIENIVTGMGAKGIGPRLKAEHKIKPLLRTIEGIGIKGAQLNKLAELTGDSEKYGEYASNAEALDKTQSAPRAQWEKLEQEGKPTEWLVQGKSNGRTDGQWLQAKLGTLISLRNQLIKAHEIVEGKKAYVIKIFAKTHKRYEQVLASIRKAEAKKREVEAQIREFEREIKKFEKEIRDIELAKSKNTQQLEKEQKGLEHQLSKAEGAPKQTAAVHAQIQTLREEIRSKQQAIDHTNGVSHDSIKAVNEKINDTHKRITKDNRHIKKIEANETRLHREEATLQEILPVLETQREGLNTTAFDIYTSGGSVGSLSFIGLQTVQGKGGDLKISQHIPSMSEVGGEIFSTEQQMQAIEESLHPVIEPVEGNTALEDAERRAQKAEEIAAINEKLAEEAEKREATLMAQHPVMEQFASVSAIAHAGNFATGGMVAATVGENGAETVLMPNGSNVVSNAERRSVVAQATGRQPDINFEEINFHEAEGKVTGRMNGRNFEQDVENINRQATRKATWNRTPGGKRDRR